MVQDYIVLEELNRGHIHGRICRDHIQCILRGYAGMQTCRYIKKVTRSLDVRLIRTYNHLHVFTRFLGATPLSEVFGVEDPCNGPSNVLSPLSSPIAFYRSHVGERE